MPKIAEFTKRLDDSSKKINIPRTLRPYTDFIGLEKIKGYVHLPLDQVDKNPFQPRKKINEDKLNELTSSIKESTLVQPITVRKVGKRYQIITGERRYLAFHKLGKKEIPAIIKENISDKEMAEIALIENIQRTRLSTIEIADMYDKLRSEFKLSAEEIAKKVGKSNQVVKLYLQIASSPSYIRDAILRSNMPYRLCVELIKINKQTSNQDFLKILKRVEQNELNVHQLEDLLKRLKTRGTRRQKLNFMEKPFFSYNKNVIKFSFKIKHDKLNEEIKAKIKKESMFFLNKIGFKNVVIG